MRIIREFICDACDETSEHFANSDVPIEADIRQCPNEPWGKMRAVLSPTSTTFTHADRSANKRARR